MLSGRAARYLGDEFAERTLREVGEIAEVRNASISQIALAWLSSQPSVTCPIIGPRSNDQLKDNLGSLAIQLTQEEKDRLDTVSAWQG
jgi:aryl-alcohol dehydrogenase-like predicted oxidoreductase